MVKGTYTGHLVSDARTYDNNGKVATQFTIGARTSSKGEDGNYVSNFVSVTVWGPQATYCARLKKGEKVMVVGDQCVKLWTGKDGKPGININVRADVVDFCSPHPQSSQGGDELFT